MGSQKKLSRCWVALLATSTVMVSSGCASVNYIMQAYDGVPI